MKNLMTVWTIIIILTVLVIYFMLSSYRWKRKVGGANLIAGQCADSFAARKWCLRNAVLAGESKAYILYYYIGLDDIMGFSLYKPFRFKVSAFRSINVVCCGWYLPKFLLDNAPKPLLEFTRKVWNFKRGEDCCVGEITEGIKALNPDKGTKILFMPCSSPERYYGRFYRLSQELRRSGFDALLFSHTYIEKRESRHKLKDRQWVNVDQNILTNTVAVGSKVIVIDDVLTTGSSIREYVKELRKYGITVVGAVFLGKTVRRPSAPHILWTARKYELKDRIRP